MLVRSLGRRWPWPVATVLALIGAHGMFAGYSDSYTANTAGFIVPAAYLAITMLVRHRRGEPQSLRQAWHITLATVAILVAVSWITFSFIGYHPRFDADEIVEFHAAKSAATLWMVPIIALPSALGLIIAVPVGWFACRRLPTLSRRSETSPRWWYRISWRCFTAIALAATVGLAAHWDLRW